MDINSVVNNSIYFASCLYEEMKSSQSLYLRGSACSLTTNKYLPWDIDFLFIVNNKEKFDKDKLKLIISNYNKSLPLHIPKIDLRCIKKGEIENIKYIHALLLLQYQSKLIKGEEIDLTVCKNLPLYRRKNILYLYIINAEVKINELVNGEAYSTQIIKEKKKRLAKRILRIGCMFYFVKSGNFTRDPILGKKYILILLDERYHFFLEDIIINMNFSLAIAKKILSNLKDIYSKI